MKFKLRQEYSPNSKADKPQAILLPDASTERLLETVFNFDLVEKDYQIYPIPAPAHSGSLNAYFITFAREKFPKKVVLGVPYLKFGNRLYHPAKSRLMPAIALEEISEKLIYDLSVFSASGEMYGFNFEDQVLVEDLFSAPPELRSTWESIHPGYDPPPRLISVSAPPVDDKEGILNQMQDDIGTLETKEIKQLKSFEKGQGIGQGLANKIEAGLLKSLIHITESVPVSPSGARWIDDLERWAAKKLNRIINSRQLETENLLKLLRENPDLGLKYALPLGHHGAAVRGKAERSYKLGMRDTNFNLENLGRSQSVDFWDLDDNTVAQLHTRYRELANREIARNNHRRAAYIFAHLLGDFHSAANTLKQGKYFNEAAEIYEKYLKNPLEAANCLKEGGLYQAAIKLYVDNSEFMKAAALYKEMSRHEKEKEMYLKAVDLQMLKRAYIEAADIHDQYLKDPDAAFKVLEENWLNPSSHGATESILKHYFTLLNKHGRFEQTCKKLQELYDNQPLGENQVSLMKALLYLGKLSQDTTIKEFSADFVTSITAHVLQQGHNEQKKRVVRLLPERDSFDKLLMRDCSTYLRNKKEPEIKTTLYHTKAKKQFQLVSQIPLDTKGKVYFDVVSTNNERYCAGATRDQVFVARLSTIYKPEYVYWDVALFEDSDLKLLPTIDEQNLLLWSSQSEQFSHLSFPNTRGVDIQVGQFPWFPTDTKAVNTNDLGFFAMAKEDTVSIFSESGKICETIALIEPGTISDNIVPFEDGYFLGKGKHLVRIEGERGEYKELKGTIKSLCRTFLQSEVRIVYCFREKTGAEIFWPKSDWHQGYSFAPNLEVRHVCFNREAGLVVFEDNGFGEAYSSVGKNLTKLFNIRVHGKIIKVAPGVRVNEFLILTETDLLVYSLHN